MIIRPALLYAAPIWGGIASRSAIKKLQLVQNKCLRMVTGHDIRTKITTLHEETKVKMI